MGKPFGHNYSFRLYIVVQTHVLITGRYLVPNMYCTAAFSLHTHIYSLKHKQSNTHLHPKDHNGNKLLGFIVFILLTNIYKDVI